MCPKTNLTMALGRDPQSLFLFSIWNQSMISKLWISIDIEEKRYFLSWTTAACKINNKLYSFLLFSILLGLAGFGDHLPHQFGVYNPHGAIAVGSPPPSSSSSSSSSSSASFQHSAPRFDLFHVENYTVQQGATAFLPCIIKNLGNESVSQTSML